MFDPWNPLPTEPARPSCTDEPTYCHMPLRLISDMGAIPSRPIRDMGELRALARTGQIEPWAYVEEMERLAANDQPAGPGEPEGDGGLL